MSGPPTTANTPPDTHTSLTLEKTVTRGVTGRTAEPGRAHTIGLRSAARGFGTPPDYRAWLCVAGSVSCVGVWNNSAWDRALTV